MTATDGDGHPVGRSVFAAGLAVAFGAAAATAHGLYEVVRASGAPTPIALLYPLITDGLALVAYAATTRLADAARRYAWTVVVLTAGLSGLAQASFLAGGVTAAPPQLRFGVGAWPAIAAAAVAHLLYLLGSNNVRTTAAPSDRTDERLNFAVRPDTLLNGDSRTAAVRAPSAKRLDRPNGPAGERARTVAREHRDRHGRLPTVSELVTLAGVSRGTAGAGLKALRAERPTLQVLTSGRDTSTDG